MTSMSRGNHYFFLYFSSCCFFVRSSCILALLAAASSLRCRLTSSSASVRACLFLPGSNDHET